MTMGQYESGQVIAVFFEKIEVWNGDVDSVWRLFRKTHPSVDNDHFVAVSDPHAVHAELAYAA
jgi:hypothetical protein